MINVNNKWKFEVDTHNNHQPFEYREVENRKEKTKEFKWVASGKFFCNLGLTLSYMIDCDLREETEGKEINIEEYLDLYQRISLELTNNFNKAK